MQSLAGQALKILRNEGPGTLAHRAGLSLARKTSFGKKQLYKRSIPVLRERIESEDDLQDILDTVLNVTPGYYPYEVSVMQLRDEIEQLTRLVEDHKPESILEIGTANGGTFYIWCRYLETAETVVSLDLPDGRFGGGYGEQKTELFRKFSENKELHFVRADSHDPKTFEMVDDLFDDGIDFLFIDGDHTYEGVKQDFEAYSQLVSDGGLIALHDIVEHPDDESVLSSRRDEHPDIEDRHLVWTDGHPDIAVDRFWNELTEEYETETIVSHPGQTWGGIGVVYV